MLRYLIIIITLLSTSPIFAKKVEINIVNYVDQPLQFILQGPTFSSQLNLPTIVSSGSEDAPGTGVGSVAVNDDATQASGTFKMGYDSQHYCEYRYSLEKQGVLWTWFMRPFRWVGMDEVSCAVDPDKHTIIVFQAMGK